MAKKMEKVPATLLRKDPQYRQQAARYAAEHGIVPATEEFGLSYSIVAQACRQLRLGAPRSPHGPRPNLSKRQVYFRALRMLLQGDSVKQAAHKLNVSEHVVQGVKKEAALAGFEI